MSRPRGTYGSWLRGQVGLAPRGVYVCGAMHMSRGVFEGGRYGWLVGKRAAIDKRAPEMCVADMHCRCGGGHTPWMWSGVRRGCEADMG